MAKLPVLMKEARIKFGFRSKRAFFYKNGGEEFFNCTYRYYTLIESGKVFPNPEILVRLLIKLQVTSPDVYIKELFKTKLSSDVTNNYIKFSEPAKETEKKSDSPGVIKVSFNEEQFQLLASSREINWLFNIFLFNTGKYTFEKIVGFTGLDRVVIKTYLDRLVATELIKQVGGLYFGSNINYVFPTNKALKHYEQKITEYNAAFSPHVPIDKNSQIFKVSSDNIVFVKKALKDINKLVIRLSKMDQSKSKKVFFYHSSIFERFDLNIEKN